MVLGVEVDPKAGAWLHRVLTGTNGQYRELACIEVVDLEVEMLLLGMFLPRPLRRLVVVDPLKSQGGSDIAGQCHPVGVRFTLVDRPAGDCGVELTEHTRITTVDGRPGKFGDG